MYLAALNGEKDKRIKSLDQLENLVMSIRLVANSTAPWGVVQCEANTANLDCFGCKGFKGHGICSHVISINHILKNFNVRYQLLAIGKATTYHTQKPAPALLKQPKPKAVKKKGKKGKQPVKKKGKKGKQPVKKKGKKGKQPQEEQPDSSEDELQEALALGAQGV